MKWQYRKKIGSFRLTLCKRGISTSVSVRVRAVLPEEYTATAYLDFLKVAEKECQDA